MKQKLFFLFAFLGWVFTVSIAVRNVLSASIPFWYDPARDMLSAWDNLHKITLIGPTSGIPGIFYGPYWIWLLSIGEIFSKDPKMVDLLILTIPYLICFPLTLFLFSKIFGKLTSVMLWLLFFYSSQNYMIFLWNPHLAPLLFLITIYLLITNEFNELSRGTLLSLIFSGVLTGFALNIHISFSFGFVIGCIIFLLGMSFLASQKKKFKDRLIFGIAYIGSFLTGAVVTFLPFLFFEVRHGFHQTKTALNAFLHGGDVVTLHGLSKPEIIYQYLLKFSVLLQVPFFVSLVLVGVSIFLLIYFIQKRKISFSTREMRLLSLLGSITVAVLGVYLAAKNPIWGYHFIGADIIALLFIGVILAKIKPLQYILLFWVFVLTIMQVNSFVAALHASPFVTSTLYTEEYIVKIIQQDAKGGTYTVYAYSPSIYTYEYSYLFRSIANKEVSYDPGLIQRKGIVYLILPKTKQTVLQDFINFRSPQNLYKTSSIWHIPDGTTIIKRMPL